jgi:hypothetical protein
MGFEKSEFCHATVVNLKTDKWNQYKRLYRNRSDSAKEGTYIVAGVLNRLLPQ